MPFITIDGVTHEIPGTAQSIDPDGTRNFGHRDKLNRAIAMILGDDFKGDFGGGGLKQHIAGNEGAQAKIDTGLESFFADNPGERDLEVGEMPTVISQQMYKGSGASGGMFGFGGDKSKSEKAGTAPAVSPHQAGQFLADLLANKTNFLQDPEAYASGSLGFNGVTDDEMRFLEGIIPGREATEGPEAPGNAAAFINLLQHGTGGYDRRAFAQRLGQALGIEPTTSFDPEGPSNQHYTGYNGTGTTSGTLNANTNQNGTFNSMMNGPGSVGDVMSILGPGPLAWRIVKDIFNIDPFSNSDKKDTGGPGTSTGAGGYTSGGLYSGI